METYKATILRTDEKTVLSLTLGEKNLEIILTEDKPNDVKDVFNQLLIELKKGEFNFELVDSMNDLYFHISSEYISQLNIELSSIYNELRDYELLNENEQ